MKDKSARTIASFLYEIICRNACSKIQINEESKEFINQVGKSLHEMTDRE